MEVVCVSGGKGLPGCEPDSQAAIVSLLTTIASESTLARGP